MLKKFTLLPLLAAGLFAFTGCKKENTITNQESLSGTWAVTGISSNYPNDWNNDGYTETDIFNTYSYCQRDIVLSFNNNGYGQSRQGCDAPWENMSWQLTNNNRRLDIYMPSGDINLDIIQFDGNTIRGNDQVQSNGTNYVITYTLSRRQ
jgi:hypothetical protein